MYIQKKKVSRCKPPSEECLQAKLELSYNSWRHLASLLYGRDGNPNDVKLMEEYKVALAALYRARRIVDTAGFYPNY
jgi:hypothetical protein